MSELRAKAVIGRVLAWWGCSARTKVDGTRYRCECRRGHFTTHRALTHAGWRNWA